MAKTTDDLNSMTRRDGRTYSISKEIRYGDVRMAIYATGRRAKELRDIVHAALHRAGGRNATRGMTNVWALSGRPKKVAQPLRPNNLRLMLKQLDAYCADGLMEIRVSGVRFD